jgi:hypothetical protein
MALKSVIEAVYSDKERKSGIEAAYSDKEKKSGVKERYRCSLFGQREKKRRQRAG